MQQGFLVGQGVSGTAQGAFKPETRHATALPGLLGTGTSGQKPWESRISTLVTANPGHATRVSRQVRGVGHGPGSLQTRNQAFHCLAGTPGDGLEWAEALGESDINPGDSRSRQCNKGFSSGKGCRARPREPSNQKPGMPLPCRDSWGRVRVGGSLGRVRYLPW